jgi:hypothetical protein
MNCSEFSFWVEDGYGVTKLLMILNTKIYCIVLNLLVVSNIDLLKGLK